MGAWVQQNVLQGVEPGPATYAVMTVYFVQGVLGLARIESHHLAIYFLRTESLL